MLNKNIFCKIDIQILIFKNNTKVYFLLLLILGFHSAELILFSTLGITLRTRRATVVLRIQYRLALCKSYLTLPYIQFYHTSPRKQLLKKHNIQWYKLIIFLIIHIICSYIKPELVQCLRHINCMKLIPLQFPALHI